MCHNFLTRVIRFLWENRTLCFSNSLQWPSTFKRSLRSPGRLSASRWAAKVKLVRRKSPFLERGDRWAGATLSLHIRSRFPPGFSCYRLRRVPALINKVMTVSRGVEGETARCAWVEGAPEPHGTVQSCRDRELMKQLPFKQQTMRETHNVLSTRQGHKTTSSLNFE